LRSPTLLLPAPFNWANAPHIDLPLIDTGTQEEEWELPIGDANDAFIDSQEFHKVFEMNSTCSDFSEDNDDEDFYDANVDMSMEDMAYPPELCHQIDHENNEYRHSRRRQRGLSESIPASYRHNNVNIGLQEHGKDEGEQCEDEVHDGREGEDLDEFGLHEEDQLSLFDSPGQAGAAAAVGTFQGKSSGATRQGPLEGLVGESHCQRESGPWIVSPG
jgi:hypothetical protein